MSCKYFQQQNAETCCKYTQTTAEMFKGTTTSDEHGWDMFINVYTERGDYLFILTLDFLYIVSLNKIHNYSNCETLCKLANLLSQLPLRKLTTHLKIKNVKDKLKIYWKIQKTWLK